jgi:putative thiamine transport system permease protein
VTRALIAALILLPVGAGLAVTLLPAFGFLPAIGDSEFSTAPWRALFDTPGFATSVALTVRTGLTATALALATALLIAARPGARVWSPLLAMPHAATAMGLAFLIAPSGWIVRLISPWLTGWTTPPDVATVGDPVGGALILGLWIKETPYLLLTTLAALAQVDAPGKLRAAASLGMPRAQAWGRVVLPLIWPQIRLPLCATLAFALTVVDMALILGPTTPPTLAVQVLRGLTNPDLASLAPASAGATLLAGLTALCLLPIILLRRPSFRLPTIPNLAPVLGAIAAATIATLALWSTTAVWRFPDALPTAWSLATWQTHAPGRETATTLALGLAATALALTLAIAHLARTGRAGQGMRALLHVPLLVPQIGFLFGLQILLLRLGLAGTPAAVLLAHLLFVLPYVMFALADPWRALDPRLARGAASLGAGKLTTLRRVTLPLLKAPLAVAAAIGFAVSCSLYLPTLFAGQGRVATLATEAIALATGTDRRIAAVVALSQAALPLAAFALARRF